MSFIAELRRRNVFRVGAAYVVGSWLIIQVVETIFPAFGFGDAAIRLVVTVLAIGMLPVVVVAWAFEITPEGLKLEKNVDRSRSITDRTGKKLDRLIMVVLALALGFFAFDKFVLDPARDESRIAAAREEGRSEAIVESFGDKSIVVLPFVNMSNDPDQEYFSDGISEELLNVLARIPELRVTGKTSAFSFKDKDATIVEIGEMLNVSHVLEGSVRIFGDRIRITAQLINARTDTNLWSKTFDRTQGDVFAIQDEIAAEVVEQLQITLLGAVPKTRRTNPRAHALTLQAKNLGEKMEPGTGEQIAALAEEALVLDPDYIPAMHMLIKANNRRMRDGLISDQEELRRFHVLKDRVLATDPDDAVMQALLAHKAFDSGDVETAAAVFQRALQIEPGNAQVLFFAGAFALGIGRNEVAATILERSAAIDPLCFVCLYVLAETYMYMGLYDESEAVRLRYMTLASGGRYHLVVLKLLQGNPEEALKETDGEDIDEWTRTAARAMALHDLGRQAESEDVLASLTKEWGDEHPYLVAEVYAWIGDKDSAFDWLDRAYRSDRLYGRDGYWFVRRFFNPLWRNLHGDPRWDAMRERVGMSVQRLAAIEFNVNLPT